MNSKNLDRNEVQPNNRPPPPLFWFCLFEFSLALIFAGGKFRVVRAALFSPTTLRAYFSSENFP